MIKVGNDILVAERGNDFNYPSINVYLVRPDGTKELVSTTEYNKEDKVIATYTYEEKDDEFVNKTIYKEVE